ncbi:MAG TPA: hypothetical protein EYO33_33755 [Phycisphaerales bacterium]|nr:hypothetical protein [Phycisphaerales bacterium]
MQDRSEEEQLWALLAQEGEEESQAVAPQVSGLSQSPTFLDRVTQRMASGVLPLFLAGVGSTLPPSMAGGWKGVVLGLLVLLALSRLLAPLARRRGFTSTARMALLFFPFTLIMASASILPIQILNDADAVITGAMYQYALETVLGWHGLSLLGVTLYLVGMTEYFLSRSRPWTKIQPAGMGGKFVAILILLVPFALYGALWQRSAPTVEEQAWRAVAEPLLPAERAQGSSPWQELYTTFNLIMLDQERPQVPALMKLAGQVERQIDRGLPGSLAEAESVDYLVKELLKDSRLHLGSETRRELAYLQVWARSVSRPRYQYIPTVEEFRSSILPHLLESSNISKWEPRIRRLQTLLPETQMMELDMNAAAFFYRESVEAPEVFGKVAGQENRRKVYLDPLRQLEEKKPFKARPLRILGREFNGSPTQLIERLTHKRDFAAWMSFRRELEPLEPAERLSRIQALQTRGANGLPQSFLEDLAGRSYGLSLGPWLETAHVILKLQKQREQGLNPTLSAQEKKRWTLIKAEVGWQLTDRLLKESRSSKTWSWRLR